MLDNTPTSVQVQIQNYDMQNKAIGDILNKNFMIEDPTVFSDGYATIGFRPPATTKTADFTVTWINEADHATSLYTKIPVPAPGKIIVLSADSCVEVGDSSTGDLTSTTDSETMTSTTSTTESTNTDSTSTTESETTTSSTNESDTSSTSVTEPETSTTATTTTEPDTTTSTTSTTESEATTNSTSGGSDYGQCGWHAGPNYYDCAENGGIPGLEQPGHPIDCKPEVLEGEPCTYEDGPVDNYGCCMSNGDLFYCGNNDVIIKESCGA